MRFWWNEYKYNYLLQSGSISDLTLVNSIWIANLVIPFDSMTKNLITI